MELPLITTAVFYVIIQYPAAHHTVQSFCVGCATTKRQTWCAPSCSFPLQGVEQTVIHHQRAGDRNIEGRIIDRFDFQNMLAFAQNFPWQSIHLGTLQIECTDRMDEGVQSLSAHFNADKLCALRTG